MCARFCVLSLASQWEGGRREITRRATRRSNALLTLASIHIAHAHSSYTHVCWFCLACVERVALTKRVALHHHQSSVPREASQSRDSRGAHCRAEPNGRMRAHAWLPHAGSLLLLAARLRERRVRAGAGRRGTQAMAAPSGGVSLSPLRSGVGARARTIFHLLQIQCKPYSTTPGDADTDYCTLYTAVHCTATGAAFCDCVDNPRTR